jgi:hypothetical protein
VHALQKSAKGCKVALVRKTPLLAVAAR